MRRIVALSSLENEKLLGASQDGSREFISLLAAICADGTTLPPSLIYQGTSGDLQDSWLEDFDASSQLAYFTVSPKGWTNDQLGFSWLETVFERCTASKAGYGYRLLIVDGHSSHVNMQFIEYCDTHRIILGILPPHSTHRLQPLDLKIFSPLATAYSNELDKLIQSSRGFTRITKRLFWSLFRRAWEKALTKSNIFSAFAAAGIHPYNPSMVLDKLKTKTPTPPSSDGESKKKTPGSVRGVRRMVKAMRANLDDVDLYLNKLTKAYENMAIDNEITHHENSGLTEALISEQKRRKRGKKMGLFPKDEPGQAIFFSPAKIASVRARQAQMEAEKEQEKLEKERERQARAAEKKQKAQETRERRETRQRELAAKRARQAEAQEARNCQKEASRQLRLEHEASRDEPRVSTVSRKRKLMDTPVVEAEEVQSSIGRNGRVINKPTRYLQ